MPPRPEPLAIVKGRWQGRDVHFRKDYLILKVITPSGIPAEIRRTISDLLNPHVASYEIRARFGHWAYIELPLDTDVPGPAEELAAHTTLVDYAEPDLAMRMAGSVNDPLLTEEYTGAFGEIYQQWGIDYLNMDTAWDMMTGNDSVLIGLVDTGIWIHTDCLDNVDYQRAMDGCPVCDSDTGNTKTG